MLKENQSIMGKPIKVADKPIRSIVQSNKLEIIRPL